MASKINITPMKATLDKSSENIYDDLLQNEEIRQLSCWIESNNSEPTNEHELVEKSLKSIDAYISKIEQVIVFADKNK